jgi:hypothetical protein
VAWLRRHAVLLVLMGVAFGLAFVIRSTAFDLYSGNKDEPVYVLQARALAEGHLTLPLYRDLAFFQPWFTAPRGGHLIFVFPPGYPAVLAVSFRLFGSMLPALGAIAAACVLGMFLFAQEVTQSRRIALVAAAVLTVSPILAIQSGLFLSYLFTLALGLLLGWSLLEGVRRTRTGLCVAAGVFLGTILLTRPLDAVLWGLPFLVYLVVLHRHALRALVGRFAWVAAGLAPLGVAMLLFNRHVTGSPTLFPVTAVDSLNRLGFGTRRLVPTAQTVDYTVHAALDAAGTNLRNLPPWAFGSFAGVVLAVVGAVLLRKAASTYLLLGIVASFGVGYLGYWGLMLMADGSRGLGPQYYIPMFVPIAVLGASALVCLWDRTRGVAVALAVVLVALTIAPMHDKFVVNRDLDETFYGYREKYDALHDAHAPRSLIFVPTNDGKFLLTDLSFAMNPPQLDASTLYAVDRGEKNIELVAHRPGRTPYVLHQEAVRDGDGYRGRYVLTKLQLQTARAFVVDQHITNPGNDPVVTASLHVGDQTSSHVLDTASTKGAQYTVRWIVTPAGATLEGAAEETTLALPQGTGSFALGVAFDSGSVGSETADRWEARYPYRSPGSPTPSIELLTSGFAYHRIPVPGGHVFAPQRTDAALESTARPASG